MRSGNIERGLRKRLWRMILAVGVFVASATGWAHAANNQLGIVIDPSFGTGGFGLLPPHPSADAGTPITPIGLIHLDVSGGYIAATLQRVAGSNRIVLTKYAESGQLDTGWGTGGTQLPGLPAPHSPANDVSTIKLVAGRENGQDIFYVAYSGYNNPNYYLAVGKFQASGAFDASFGFGGYASSTLPVSAPNGILTVQGAAFTEVFGLPVLVVAVFAPGYNMVFTRAHGSGTAALSDQGGGSVVWFGNVPAVTQMRTLGPNHVELVGSVSNYAIRVDYDAGALNGNFRYFHLPCPVGTFWSAIDSITYPAAFGGDALVYGRAYCLDDTGVNMIVARVANIGSASPAFVWSTSLETNTPPICNTPKICPPTLLAHDEGLPGYAITVTPRDFIRPVRTAGGTEVSGVSLYNGDSTPFPSTYRGTVFRYPRLVSFGVSSFGGIDSLVALTVDGVFKDGFD